MSNIRIWRTSSFAVRNDLARLVFIILTLIIGAAMEELLPKYLGVGFPVLLTAVQFQATRGNALMMLLFAIAAGGVEDSISNLPTAMSVSYFLLLATMTRWAGLPKGLLLLAYPGYQIWLHTWYGVVAANVFNRIILALPIGVITFYVVGVALKYFGEEAAVDEE